MNKYLKLIIYYFISLLIILGSVIGGIFTRGFFITGGIIILSTAIIIFTSVKAADLHARSKYVKKQAESNPFSDDEALSEAVQIQKKDPAAGLKSLKKLRSAAVLHAVCDMLLVCAIDFGMACCVPSAFFLTPFAIISVFFAESIVEFLLSFPDKPNIRKYIIPEEYPVIFSMSKKAAVAAGFNPDIRVSFSSENTFEVQYGKNSVFEIGLTLLGVLTESETQSMLNFEAAFKSSPEIVFLQKIETFFNGRTQNKPAFSGFFDYSAYCLGTVKTRFEKLYPAVKAVVYPELKLKTAKKTGDEHLVCAYLKMLMFDFYNRLSNGYLDEPFYKPAEPRSNGCTLPIRAFTKAIRQEGEKWSKVLLKAQAPRNSLFPSAGELANACGVANPQIILPEHDGAFGKEVPGILNDMDETMRLIFTYNGSYPTYRQAFFIQPSITVEQFELNGGLEAAEKNSVSAEDLRAVAEAYNELIRPADAEKICDYVLLTNPDADYALFLKGSMLLCRKNDDGIAMIERAMELNTNYVFEGAVLILDYYRLTLRDDEESKFRNKIIALTEKTALKLRAMAKPTPKDILAESGLSEKTLAEIRAQLIKIGGNVLDKTYAVTKKKHTEYSCIFIILVFDKNADAVERHEIVKNLFYYLDIREEQFNLIDSTDLAPAVFAGIRSLKNALIYDRGNT